MRKEGEYDVFINSLKNKTNEILGENTNEKDIDKYKEYLSFVIKNELIQESVEYFDGIKINEKLARIMRFLISENYSGIVYEINDLFNYIMYNECENKVPIYLILINLYLTLEKGL